MNEWRERERERERERGGGGNKIEIVGQGRQERCVH